MGSQALEAKRRRGERTGEIPYGFRLGDDGVSLERDACEQSIIRAVLSLDGQGYSLTAIARHLSGRGATTRNGTRLTHKQIGRILRRYGGTRPVSPDQKDHEA